MGCVLLLFASGLIVFNKLPGQSNFTLQEYNTGGRDLASYGISMETDVRQARSDRIPSCYSCASKIGNRD